MREDIEDMLIPGIALAIIIFIIMYACTPRIDYIKRGDPCHADSCEVLR